MKKITIISGKGGTGKTTIVSNLAVLADNLVLADCDVDAPNLHLLLKPDIKEDNVFMNAKLAVKNEDICTNCGICYEVCKFNAISPELEIDPIRCDGCGVCVAMCPEKALSLEEQETGHIFVSETKFGSMVHARLKSGAENSGKLVSEVRDVSDQLAEKEEKGLILIDGSPGIGCPVIASLTGVDYTLVVIEPTLSGLSDLKRILELTRLFNITTFVLINKYDLNEDISQEIEQYCTDNDIEIIGNVSFSPLINQSLRNGELLLESYPDSKPANEIKEAWDNLNERL